MKNLLLLFSLIILSVSCEDVQDNFPALQAKVDNVLFQANYIRGEHHSSGNYFVLLGDLNDEKITLKANYPPANELLEFGENSSNYATFERANGIVYTTQTEGGSGSMIFNNVDTSEQTITGDFKFTAISQSQDTIIVSGGIFYKANYIIVE